MKQKHTWLFITSFIFFGFILNAQENKEIDSVSIKLTSKKNNTLALRAGIDLFMPVLSQFDSDFQGLEIVGDLNFYKDLFLAAEIGSLKKRIQSEQINFTTNGTYIKLGLDYNLFNNWKGMKNSIFIGLRYGRSIHKHTINNYLIYITHHYWETPITNKGYSNGERKSLSSGWIEFLFGIKTEVWKNFYLGISLRLNRILSQNQPEDFGNLYVPGFNKVTDENNFGVGFNYTITYSFPFRFKKNKK